MTPLKPIENLLAVEVREDFIHAELVTANDTVLLKLTAMNETTTTHGEVLLPPGSYEILFTTSTATEQQAAGVVESSHSLYRDYEPDRGVLFTFSSAIKSLQSLLASNDLDAGKNYLLIKRNEQ